MGAVSKGDFRRLFEDGFTNLRNAVANGYHHGAAGTVDVAFAGLVVNIDPFTPFDRRVELGRIPVKNVVVVDLHRILTGVFLLHCRQHGHMPALLVDDFVNSAVLVCGDQSFDFMIVENGIHLTPEGEVQRRRRILDLGQLLIEGFLLKMMALST